MSVWINATQVVSGDESLRIIYPSVSNASTLIRSLSLGDSKWVSFSMMLPTQTQLNEVMLSYEISKPGLVITQVRISQMERPSKMIIVHDDSAISNDPTITSYTSQISPSITAEKPLILSLRLNCENTDGEVILGAVRLGIVETNADTATKHCTPSYSLSEFGDYSTIEKAYSTLATAVDQILKQGGGQLCIPQDAPGYFTPHNLHQLNNPFYGSAAKDIPNLEPTVGVTIIDYRDGFRRTYLPPAGSPDSETLFTSAGQISERILSQDLPIGGRFKAEAVVSRYLGGGSSYYLPLLQSVIQGSNQKFYVPTHRGLFSGQTLSIRSASGNSGFNTKILDLGIDQSGPYFIADAPKDMPVGAGIYNKNILGGLLIADTDNCDNQSPSLTIKRKSHGAGDTFGIWNELRYQSDIMSAGGDEGAVGVTSELIHDLNCFWGTVETWDSDKRELVYKSSRTTNSAERPLKPHNLGTSRPLINMNSARWTTQGKVLIVAAGISYLREGKLQTKARLGDSLIIGDKANQWDRSIIGQFFTIDDPTEYYKADESYHHVQGGTSPNPIRRWWHITDLETRSDGRFNLYVERIWWNNTDVIKGGASLFRIENFTYQQGNEKYLKYIIAPGAWVSDVRDAVALPSPGKVGLAEDTDKRKIKLAPASDDTNQQDSLFQPGDSITNAPGPFPWNPSGFRSRHFGGFPTMLDTVSFDSFSASKVQLSAGLLVRDAHQGKKLETILERQKDHKPCFKSGVRIKASTDFGLYMDGPFRQAGITLTTGPEFLYDSNILFGDKTKAGLRITTETDAAIDLWSASTEKTQAIRWKWWDGVAGKPGNPNFSTLSIKPRAGDFVFEGGHLDVNGQGSLNQQGISASSMAAKNLRGIDVKPQLDNVTGKFFISFSVPEVDENYCIQVETSWLTQKAITQKTNQGFYIEFAVAPPTDGTVDWLLIR